MADAAFFDAITLPILRLSLLRHDGCQLLDFRQADFAASAIAISVFFTPFHYADMPDADFRHYASAYDGCTIAEPFGCAAAADASFRRRRWLMLPGRQLMLRFAAFAISCLRFRQRR